MDLNYVYLVFKLPSSEPPSPPPPSQYIFLETPGEALVTLIDLRVRGP